MLQYEHGVPIHGGFLWDVQFERQLAAYCSLGRWPAPSGGKIVWCAEFIEIAGNWDKL